MDVLKFIIEQVDKLREHVTNDYLLYGCAAIILLAFLFPLLFGKARAIGKFNKARKLINKSIKDSVNLTTDEVVDVLPRRAADQFDIADSIGEMPSFIMNVDSSVNVPFSTSEMSKATRSVVVATVFMAPLFFLLANVSAGAAITFSKASVVGAAVLVGFGFILRYLSAWCVSCSYAKSIKSYYIVSKFLDEKMAESLYKNSECGHDCSCGHDHGTDEFQRVNEQTALVAPIAPVVPIAPIAPIMRSAVAPSVRAEEMIEKQPDLSPTEDVINRIEQIAREGGSLAQMREVALNLQTERAKLENKTPVQQRKLNDALALLLKAMNDKA